MKRLRAGGWTMELSDPYPIWVKLEGPPQPTHRDLADLAYLAGRAVIESRLLLPDRDREEV